MKKNLLFFAVVASISCGINKPYTKYFYYVEPFKEQEVKLVLNEDSSFSFRDITGCNQFEYTGKYEKRKSNTIEYLLFDSVRVNGGIKEINSDKLFPLKSGDTAWIINGERIFIHRHPFNLTSNSKLNLQEIRYKKLKEYYISLLGTKGFLQVFGDGKGEKEAKKRLLDCSLPDIDIR